MAGWLIFLGGLSGALGVSLSAMSAHLPQGPMLASGAQMLLFHAPAFLALAGLARISVLGPRVIGLGALIWMAGLALFAGDLSWRVLAGSRLFPNAAPIGGSALIAGWLWFMITGLISLLAPRKSD